jgi:hypothetical protein
MIQTHIAAIARELSLSSRWQHPDAPGSAHVQELAERVSSPTEYRRYRNAPEGEYLLAIIESFQEALNDEWLPYEIVGLPLTQAQQFIQVVADKLALSNVEGNNILELRQCYSSLRLASSVGDARSDA